MEQPAKCMRCNRTSRETDLLEALRDEKKIYFCPDCFIEMSRSKIYRIGMEEKRKSETQRRYIPE